MSDLNDIEKGQICQSTIESLYRASGGLRNFPGLLKKIIETKAWERRVSKGRLVELCSLRELITEKPIRGWGEDLRKVENVIKDDAEALAMFRQEVYGTLAEPRRPTKEEQLNKDCGTRDIGYGNNDYWQARIQRDCPEELEAIKAGAKRIIDVRKERGWVSSTKRVTLTGDPVIDRKRLLETFGCDYMKGLGVS